MSELFAGYQTQVEKLPIYLQDEVGVLFSSVLAVTEVEKKAREGLNEVNDNQKASIDEFYNADGKFVKLSEITSQSFLYNLLRNSDLYQQMRAVSRPVVIPVEDQLRKKFLSVQVITEGRKPINVATSRGNTTRNDKDQPSQQEINPSVLEKELFEFEYEAKIRFHISRLLSDSIFPLRPLMSEVERGIKESELLTFTSLAASDLYRSNQLQEFSDMILQKTKALPNFTGALTISDGEEGSVLRRKYFKSLSAFLFAQLLSEMMKTDPLVLKRYYSMTDELLFALHWPPPDRRNVKSVWQRTIMTESDSTEAVDDDAEIEEVPAADAQKGRQVVWETVTMTPAGQMLATVDRLNQDNELSWFTAKVGDYALGVRLHQGSRNQKAEDPEITSSVVDVVSSPPFFHFFCETSEKIRYLAYLGPKPSTIKKPDKHGTVCLTSQFPNELQVQLHSNGDIRILSSVDYLLSQATFYNQFHQQKLYPLLPEKSRFISEEGRIVRRFDNPRQLPFSHEIYYPNGQRDLFLLVPFFKYTSAQTKRNSLFYSPATVAMMSSRTPNPAQLALSSSCLEMTLLHKIPKDTAFIRFLLSDEVECYNEQSEIRGRFSLSEIHSTNYRKEIVTDAESKCISSYFPDGRLITEYPNGLKIIQFPDNTKMIYNSNTKMLTISRHVGYPEIEIDVEVDSTCRKHSQGMEIPINKGGERVRNRISFPDGSAACIKYDTRVTAKCNGSIKLVRRDRTAILARDDGSVTFSPSTAWTRDDEDRFLADCKIDDLDPKDSRVDAKSLTAFLPFTSKINEFESSTTVLPPPVSTSKTAVVNTVGVLPPALMSRKRGGARTIKGSTYSRQSPERGRSASPPLGAATGHNLFASDHEPDAVVTVDLTCGNCLIKDYEFNSFEISLAPQKQAPIPTSSSSAVEKVDANESIPTDNVEISESVVVESTPPSALDVKVQLAGEVPGLKPPAVARSPKPPRLFVVSRNGEATEVLSVQDVRLLEHQTQINVDVTKHASQASLPPNELGPATQWRYFTERKFIGSYLHGYLFQEIFGHRYYQSIKIPASTLFMLYNKPALHYHRENEIGYPDPGRIFEVISLVERLPVSKEGYTNITVSIQQCEQFRQQRILSIDRFAVDDPRPPEQIKEEEELTKRLKQIYKLAKINAAKKKKAKGDDDGDDDGSHAQSASKVPLSARSTGSSPSPMAKEYKPSKGHETIKEGENEDEDGEQEDEDDHFGSDDEEGEPDPEEAALRAVFDDFSSPSNVEGFVADVIPVSSLQEAFIRIINQFISQDLIDKAVLDTDEVDVNLEEFTLPEFRLIFQSLQRQLQISDERKGDEDEPYTPYVDRYLDEDDDGERQASYRPHSSATDDIRSLPTSRTKESYYSRDRNDNPRKNANSKTAPPLNLSGIYQGIGNKDEINDDVINSMESIYSNEGGFAVGLPINAVRRAKTTK